MSLDPHLYAVAEPELLRLGCQSRRLWAFQKSPARGIFEIFALWGLAVVYFVGVTDIDRRLLSDRDRLLGADGRRRCRCRRLLR